jgi:hypothetical protein
VSTVTVKVAAIIAILAAFYLAGFYQGGMRSKTALEAFQAAQAKAVAKDRTNDANRAAAELLKTRAAADAYQKERDDLALAAIPAPVVRLCISPGAPVPGAAAAPAGGSTPAPGPSPQVPRGDIDYGPALFNLADQYDQLMAKVREAQASK